MEIMIETNDPRVVAAIVEGPREFLKALDPNRFEVRRERTPRRRPDPRDPEEARDDLHFRAPAKAELSGLIRRARAELSHGDVKATLFTLGRADDLCDAEGL